MKEGEGPGRHKREEREGSWGEKKEREARNS